MAEKKILIVEDDRGLNQGSHLPCTRRSIDFIQRTILKKQEESGKRREYLLSFWISIFQMGVDIPFLRRSGESRKFRLLC